MRFFLSSMRGEFEKAAKGIEKSIARGATGAVTEAGENAKKLGRENIASAGFSIKWQNALRMNVYPRGRDSMRPAALVFHKIPYAEVFELGATIRGRPKLWLPLPTVQRTRGGKKMTPKRYVQEVGPLFTLNRAGKPPLLMGKAQSSPGLGDRRGPKTQSVPLFVGVDTVNIRKKFRIIDIVRQQAARLPSLYLQHVPVS